MMRTWIYSYKTSDGFRHEAEMSAPTKDAVYDALRERGIRAIRVNERIEPIVRQGFRGLRGVEWAVLVLVVLGMVVAAICWGAMSSRSAKASGAKKSAEIAMMPSENPAYVNLSETIAGLVESFRKESAKVDFEFLSNYALIERVTDLSEQHAKIKAGRDMIDGFRKRSKEMFLRAYNDIPQSCATERIEVQRLYGVVMESFDELSEKIDGAECAIELLARNRGKWSVCRGEVVWSDVGLSDQFESVRQANGLQTSRWRKDFGELGSKIFQIKK